MIGLSILLSYFKLISNLGRTRKRWTKSHGWKPKSFARISAFSMPANWSVIFLRVLCIQSPHGSVMHRLHVRVR